MKKMGLIVLALFWSFSPAQAQTEIRFTNTELKAVFILLRPELSSFELDGLAGAFEPAPSLKFMGVKAESVSLNLGLLSGILGIGFNHFKTKGIHIRFEEDALKVTVSFDDQENAVNSRLGSISIHDAALNVLAKWQPDSSGVQNLEVVSSAFTGTLKGTGVLKSNAILKKIEKVVGSHITDALDRILGQPGVQGKIQTGLLDWAMISTGNEFHRITPQSLDFYREGNSSGLLFRAE